MVHFLNCIVLLRSSLPPLRPSLILCRNIQCTSHVLSVVETTEPGSAAYPRKAGTSVLTSVPYPDTSYGAVAMHDGPLEGD